ncbi:MAG: hypothetical protein L6R41_006578 [Letrouitia leprolyta]|nr:MAG: hypothetical protein L6R41_006578 [Letrouitia leprolyta]
MTSTAYSYAPEAATSTPPAGQVPGQLDQDDLALYRVLSEALGLPVEPYMPPPVPASPYTCDAMPSSTAPPATEPAATATTTTPASSKRKKAVKTPASPSTPKRRKVAKTPTPPATSDEATSSPPKKKPGRKAGTSRFEGGSITKDDWILQRRVVLEVRLKEEIDAQEGLVINDPWRSDTGRFESIEETEEGFPLEGMGHYEMGKALEELWERTTPETIWGGISMQWKFQRDEWGWGSGRWWFKLDFA